tara:strand:- start:246 stop:377 length:132 start_codon:yes stop_codon:yes gene_type:complete
MNDLCLETIEFKQEKLDRDVHEIALLHDEDKGFFVTVTDASTT